MTLVEYLRRPQRDEHATRARLDLVRLFAAAEALDVVAPGVDFDHADATDARNAAAAAASSVALACVAREQDERDAATHASALHHRDARKQADSLADTYGAVAEALRDSARLARLNLPEIDE